MRLKKTQTAAVVYHDLFDYPLTKKQLHKWSLHAKIASMGKVENENGYYFVKGRGSLVSRRKRREKYSISKLVQAQKATKWISLVPSVKMVGLTGSLAMKNANKASDIDLLIITTSGTLWATRVLVYMVLTASPFSVRRPGERERENVLCLNMWLDEDDLATPKKNRNLYTAHEIAQIMPLANKSKAYEKLIAKNKWILGFWPNSVHIAKATKNQPQSEASYVFILRLFEPIARLIQLKYMASKRTRETVTPTRAFFHPTDWGAKVTKKIKTL